LHLIEKYHGSVLFEGVKEELRKEDKPFSTEIQLGAMIEVPAAAISVGDTFVTPTFAHSARNAIANTDLRA